MKTIAKKIAQAVLAIALVAAVSKVALAVWDSTTGNMPSYYNLCFGANNSDCLTGNSVAHAVSLIVNNVTGLSINSSGAVSVPGSLAVTGSSTLTGGVVMPVAAPLTLGVQTTTQLSARTDPYGTVFIAEEATNGVVVSTNAALCWSTAAVVGSYVYFSTGTGGIGFDLKSPCTQ